MNELMLSQQNCKTFGYTGIRVNDVEIVYMHCLEIRLNGIGSAFALKCKENWFILQILRNFVNCSDCSLESYNQIKVFSMLLMGNFVA